MVCGTWSWRALTNPRRWVTWRRRPSGRWAATGSGLAVEFPAAPPLGRTRDWCDSHLALLACTRGARPSRAERVARQRGLPGRRAERVRGEELARLGEVAHRGDGIAVREPQEQREVCGGEPRQCIPVERDTLRPKTILLCDTQQLFGIGLGRAEGVVVRQPLDRQVDAVMARYCREALQRSVGKL